MPRAGLEDHAGLIIGMARNGLDFPAPPERDARTARLGAILQPLLRP